ncbi:hypothetical protein R1sor_013221 [Riccia sorocarpa]|uniref:Cytochrome P450 n=1 Tax=Riccia sorocarpa TaxID=122646 RepID=A0ABD3H5X1_9MARC
MDFFLVITTLTVLVASILFDWWYFLKLRSKRLPPGPSPWPIVGAIPYVVSVRHETSTKKMSQSLQSKYGKILTVWLGKTPMIFIHDPELTYDALVKQGAYFSNRAKNSSMGIISSGWRTVGTSEGPWTVALRKNVMTHMLGPSRLKAFKPLRDRAYGDIVNDLRSVAAAAEDGVAQVNLRSVVVNRVLRFVLVLTFGVELEENLIQEILLNLGERFRLGDESITGGNYCETLFQLEKEFPDFNNSVITSLCAEFLNTAFFTATLAIDHTMALLCDHPVVNEKLYQEIEAVVGRRAVDESDLPNLPYLSAVVRESLRVWKFGLMSLPHATSELRKLGGYDIPTDAVVFFVLESFHLDPTYWSEPSVFKPERFLENDLDVLGTKNFSFLPFSAGRRVCPGSQLGMLQISVVVACLVQTFEWEKVLNVKNPEIGTVLRARPRSV